VTTKAIKTFMQMLWAAMLLPACMVSQADGTSAPPGAPPPDAQRLAVMARAEALRSLEVECTIEEVFTPTPTAMESVAKAAAQPGFVRFELKTGTEFSHHRLCLLDGRWRWEHRRSEEAIESDRKNRFVPSHWSVRTCVQGTLEWLSAGGDPSRLAGSVSAASGPPDIPVILIALGLREGERGGWMSADAVRAMEAGDEGDGRFILRRTDGLGRTQEWVFDRARAYALVNYREFSGSDPHPLIFDLVADDFREVQGILLPFRMVQRDIHTNGVVVATMTVQVQEYVLNGPENTEELYHMRWPRGVRVLDRRTGNGYLIEKEGQVLTNELLAASTRPPQSSISAGEEGVRLVRSTALPPPALVPPTSPAPRTNWWILGIVAVALVGAVALMLRGRRCIASK
jgi:hypothetical protein